MNSYEWPLKKQVVGKEEESEEEEDIKGEKDREVKKMG